MEAMQAFAAKMEAGLLSEHGLEPLAASVKALREDPGEDLAPYLYRTSTVHRAYQTNHLDRSLFY